MKQLSTLFILSILSLVAFSQKDTVFLKNKLYIVETEYPLFNSALKEVMTRLWNISEIGGYITRKELKQMIKSKENSFVDPTVYYWRSNSNMNHDRSSGGIFFYHGKPKEPYLFTAEKVSYFGGWVGDNFDSAVYKLELMIRGVMNQFAYAGSMDSIQKKYNLSLLKKEKILLVNSKYFSDNKRDEVISKNAFEKYPYGVEIASSARIAEYIKAKDNRYVLAAPIVNDDTRMVQILDVETGLFLGGFQRSGMFALPIRSKDVESLIKLIEK
ncbi:MAG: hypothetical protein JWP81_5003 [Ferruginibacter sp.]|nr:hypothetical protein [Ferruginibacter sp.]